MYGKLHLGDDAYILAVINAVRKPPVFADEAQAEYITGQNGYTSVYARVKAAVAEGLPYEALAEQEGDFDADSRWALAWFEQSGFTEGGSRHRRNPCPRPRTPALRASLKPASSTSSRGKVRLLKPAELPPDWDPLTDNRLTNWEIVPTPPHPGPRNGRRARRRCDCRQAQEPRDGPRAVLPPLHPLRAQETSSRSPLVQRPRAELAE